MVKSERKDNINLVFFFLKFIIVKKKRRLSLETIDVVVFFLFLCMKNTCKGSDETIVLKKQCCFFKIIHLKKEDELM